MSIVEKEAFAIASILEHLHSMLYGQVINIYCDNRNVTNIHNTRAKPLHKLYLRINEYNPKIMHIDGKSNQVADYLSRIYEDDPIAADNAQIAAIDAETFPLSYQVIAEAQRTDPALRPLIDALETNSTTKLNDKQRRTLEHVKLVKQRNVNLLTRKENMFIPISLRKLILDWIHSNYLHPGEKRMIAIMSRNMYWVNMNDDIRKHVKRCLLCRKNKKTSKQYGKLTPTTIHTNLHRFEVIAVDLQGPWPVSRDNRTGVEFKYLLTVIDIYSRWCELIPLTRQQAELVAESLDHEWFCRYPRPEVLLSDCGPNLKGGEFNELLDSYGIEHHYTTTYMATANAICERMHGTINQILRTIDYKDWHSKIPSIAFALRASVHSATKQSPSDIVFGMDMVLPFYNSSRKQMDFIKPTQTNTVAKDLERMNKSRIPHVYKPNDLVFIRKLKEDKDCKLDGDNDGPFIVHTVHNNNTLTVNKHGLLERINIRRIIPWIRE
jgi:transposase InsO family protein